MTNRLNDVKTLGCYEYCYIKGIRKIRAVEMYVKCPNTLRVRVVVHKIKERCHYIFKVSTQRKEK